MTIDPNQYRTEPSIEELEAICARWDRAVEEAPIWGEQHPWESVYAHALLARKKEIEKLQLELRAAYPGLANLKVQLRQVLETRRLIEAFLPEAAKHSPGGGFSYRESRRALMEHELAIATAGVAEIAAAEERGVCWALEYDDGAASPERVKQILESCRSR